MKKILLSLATITLALIVSYGCSSEEKADTKAPSPDVKAAPKESGAKPASIEAKE